MRSPSITSETSRSEAAAALLEMLQTPPQKAKITHVSHSPSGNPAEAAVNRSSPGTPTKLKSNIHIFPSPTSDCIDSVDIAKVSNSDDEDMGVQLRNFHHDTVDASQAIQRHEVLHVENPIQQVRPAVSLTPAPETDLAPGLAVKKRPSLAPIERSSYAAVESEHSMHSTSAIGSVSDRPIGLPAGLTERKPQTAQPILTIGPDELQSYLRHAASFGGQGYGASLRHASTPLHWSHQPLQQTQPKASLFNGATMGQRPVSQPPPQTQYVLQPASVDAMASQRAQQFAPGVGEAHAPPISYNVLAHDRVSSEGSDAWEEVQIPRAPPRAPPTRVKVPPKYQASAVPRDGFGPKPMDVRDLTYRSIRAINMPARIDLKPGQDPPEPLPDSQPYGDDIDYRVSMIIWWCDDLELSYSETVRRYRLKFPEEKLISEDTVRKRHILFVEKLAKRYGLKPQDKLEEPGSCVARRGKQIGHKYNTINGVRVYSAVAGHDVAGTVRRRRVRIEPTQHKGFLKACICVWKDTANVSFEQIRQRLKEEYSWNIGTNTVQKLYYSERARVYDTHNESGTVEQQGPIKTADEDLEQLRVHFRQRQTYLLTTFGHQVRAQDAVYMQQLEQLIESMEQAQLRQAQQTGSGPIQINHDTFEDEPGAEEVDVTMQDADP